ncbi:MAG: response regulator [Deltaproteobacteria bacterium]|nr:response regulator [Deltaproteobacteria bacterium]
MIGGKAGPGLEELEERLRRSEARLVEIQAIARLGSWEWDIATNAVTWSPELYRQLGFRQGEVEPTFEIYLARVHPDDRAFVCGLIGRALVDLAPVDFEFRIVRTDGSILFARGRAEVVIDEAGRPVRMVGTGQDQSERKKLEEQLVLAGRLATVGTLASGVSHEINNPLSWILSNVVFAGERAAELAARLERARAIVSADPSGAGPATGRSLWARFAGDEMLSELTAVRDALSDAREGAERARDVVRDLGVFGGADEERRAPVHVVPILESTLALATNEIRHRARLVRELGGVPPVEASEARLAQVFMNLLVNAAHAIPEGRAEANEICVVSRTDQLGNAVIEVHDTGCGIDPAARERIFDPFFTTKGPGGGAGLGLSLCHAIVASIGGRIEVTSELGSGSTFRVVLPAARCRPSSAPPAARSSHAPRRGKILVIDDEPMVLDGLGRALSGDHEVVGLASSREALERLTRGDRFDLILCDLMMPDTTGADLHEELTRVAPEQAERIVFMTGGAFTPRAAEFLDRVPNRRLIKPFSLQELRALIAAILV